MLEKDAEDIFNLRRALTTDPDERLTLAWEDLENIYGHRNREPRTELDKLYQNRWLNVPRRGGANPRRIWDMRKYMFMEVHIDTSLIVLLLLKGCLWVSLNPCGHTYGTSVYSIQRSAIRMT